jgi:excisionase family DNA binding protein
MIGIKEAAVRLGVADSTIRRWLKDGALPYYRIGGRIRFEEQDIEDYKQGKRVEAVTDKQEPITPAYWGRQDTQETLPDQEEYITPDELAAVQRGIEDIKQGRYVTLEGYRSGKRP